MHGQFVPESDGRGVGAAIKGDVVEAYSAGIEAHGLNPLAVKAMAEAGVDIGGQKSKTTEAVREIAFDYVVTVCGHAHESCPTWLMGSAKVVHAGFEDPPKLAAGAKTEEEAMVFYRRVRDEIERYVRGMPEVLEG